MSETAPIRRRTHVACKSCRERKTKCSGEHPTCQRCVTRGLVCEYSDAFKTRGRDKEKQSPPGRRSSNPDSLNFNPLPVAMQAPSRMNPMPPRLQPTHFPALQQASYHQPSGYDSFTDSGDRFWPPHSTSTQICYLPPHPAFAPISLSPTNGPSSFVSDDPHYLQFPVDRHFVDHHLPAQFIEHSFAQPNYMPISGPSGHVLPEPYNAADESRRSSLEGSILLQPLTHAPAV